MPPTESDQLQWFSEFWQLYPRKVAKADAWKRFRKLVTTPQTFDEVMAGIRAQLPIFARRKKEHVPYPATWLNRESWNDEHDSTVSRPRVIDCPKCGDTGTVIVFRGIRGHVIEACSCPAGNRPAMFLGPIDARDAL